MVVAADRVPDHHGVRVAETVSVRPLSAEDSGQEKQMITIDDYEDENYTYDQQTEDGRFTCIIFIRTLLFVQIFFSYTFQPY